MLAGLGALQGMNPFPRTESSSGRSQDEPGLRVDSGKIRQLKVADHNVCTPYCGFWRKFPIGERFLSVSKI